MIRINLAQKKQAGAAVAGTRVGTFGKMDFGTSLDRFKDPELVKPLRRAILPIIVGVLATYTLDSYKASEIEKVAAQITEVNSRKPQLQKELAEYKALEEIRKTLESDEFAIRTKIDTIQKLIVGRGAAPKLLISLAGSLPESVWLSELKIADGNMTLLGYSLNMGQVSDFMKSLGESAYFADLNLKSSQQVKDGTGMEVTNFELGAKRK